jgi:NAD(P)-dependent dehydrogenase (short-subunit alcohol dehydrogenase family)
MSLWWYTPLPSDDPATFKPKMPSTFNVDPKSLTNIRNKVVLITGGSSGIGLATAILIASLDQSNRIAIIDRSPPPASLSVPASRLFFHKCDITSWPAQRSGFQGAIDKFGRIDAVFVNAGIAEYKDQIFTDELDSEGKLAEPDRRVLDIDISAATDTVKLAVHWLRKNGGNQGGSIVMTASLAGYLGSAGAPLYSAAKHGLSALTILSIPKTQC